MAGVLGNALFAVLALFTRYLVKRFRGANPFWRRRRIVMVTVLWVLSNIVYVVWISIGLTTFLVLSAFIPTLVLGSELIQFWRVGLVGADRQVRTGVDYVKALDMCSTSLDFLGIGASKLTDKREVFERAVDSCNRPDRAIRFLLSRPDSEGLARIALMAGRDKTEYQRTVQNSLRAIADLRNHRAMNVSVRFYKDFPAFRLMFINDSICLSSHYVLGKGDGSTLPQLHIVKDAGAKDVNSLYYAFTFYFDSIWRDAEEWNFDDYL
jgi:hypothetical protein